MQLAASRRDHQPAEQPDEQQQRAAQRRGWSGGYANELGDGHGAEAQPEVAAEAASTQTTTTLQHNEGISKCSCTATAAATTKTTIISTRSDSEAAQGSVGRQAESVLGDCLAEQDWRTAYHGAHTAAAAAAAARTAGDTANKLNCRTREADVDSPSIISIMSLQQQQQQHHPLHHTAAAAGDTATATQSLHFSHSPISMPHPIGRWRWRWWWWWWWQWLWHQRLALSFICSLLLLLLPLGTHAGCREEPTRACEAICTPDGKNCTLRALLLLPDDDMYLASMRRTLPILYLAEQTLRARQMLPAHVRFQWMAEDVQCDAAYAVIKAMDGIVKNCAHVVFGPVCDYALAAVSRITKYFNSNGTPLISVGGATYDFEKKKTSCADEFYMLIRTGTLSFESMSELTLALMKRYNWSHSIFYYERDGQNNVAGQHTCFLMMNSLGKQMRKENMIFAQFPIDPNVTNRTAEMKREIGNKHAIVIMCAQPENIRRIMLTAEELNMIDSGEYVFINIELFSRAPDITRQPWYNKNDITENNDRARKAYAAILTVTPMQPNDDENSRVSNKIKEIAASKYNYTFQDNEPISTFVTTFFDGVLLYATALNESIRADPTTLTRSINGTDMVRRMWNRTITGITGNVTIDANGDRISAYSLLDMNPETGYFEVVANFLHNRLEFVPGKTIHWAGDRLEAPPDMPTCGYDGTKCPDNSLPGYAILSIVLGIVVLLMTVCFVFGYRHYKSEAEINSMTWKVSAADVVCPEFGGRGLRGSFHSLVRQNSQLTLMSDDLGSFCGDRQMFIPVGIYRGCEVAIKTIEYRNINLTRSLMLELKRMKDLQHDHLVKFYGACLDPPKRFLLTEYCPKGSLQDILENEQFQLDWMFKLSLMHDIVRGMQFLHNSDIRSHGNLKSSNCVVDSRFVLKLTDFGLHALKRTRYDMESDVEDCNSHAYWSKLLWTAPELLKMESNRPPEGTQKGDVYSFGIIVHEISTRQGPFYLGKTQMEKSPKEIIQLVKGYPEVTEHPFRPYVRENDAAYDIREIMTNCWSEDPTDRPDFNALKTIIRKINKDNETGNIVDNLLKRMEMYANNLEELVEERTEDYIEEKKKCEKLLYQLLPQSVAAQLISGQPVVAETFDQVTIYFSDIVGFTAISAESTPMQVVQFLNDLYTCFDSIVENFDVYKVETIGDAYMVVSGLPIRNGNQHAREIARLALALLGAVHKFKIHHRPNDQLKLRIGLHSGTCVAGVVGLKMPRYCLFGDTVNTASRMESNGEALRIHISEKTKLALDEFGTFITTRRGYVPMKGKGEMLTYWLEGEMPKPESPAPAQQLLLSRRSSLKHPPQRYGSGQQKQYSELSPTHLQLQQLLLGEQISHQNSPTLRVKRKISSSSPKLNGGEYLAEDFNYYLDNAKPTGQKDKCNLTVQAVRDGGGVSGDIYSSRSLCEPIKDATSHELANLRLPLSGALKNHNNNLTNNHIRKSYSQLLQSNSNSNLSGILQPSATRLRLKPSPTISTLVMAARSDCDASSVHSGVRIEFNVAEDEEEEQEDKDDDEKHRAAAEERLVAQSKALDADQEDEYSEDEQQPLNNHLNSSKAHLLDERTNGGANINNLKSICNSNSNSNNNSYSSIVKANNVKNFNLLCNSNNKNSSNSMLPVAGEERSAAVGAGAGSSGRGGAAPTSPQAPTPAPAPISAVGKGTANAVTQPLLAKINS